MFESSVERKKREQLELAKTEISPCHDTIPGENTSCLNFEITTKLGWIAWKDREASLYALFERGFGATRCELKISDSFETIALEIEIPNDQLEKFNRLFKSKTLALEIDKIHGIDPMICTWTDCRLSNLRKSHGSTFVNSFSKSSTSNIEKRLENLEKCSASRQKEVSAMQDFLQNLQLDLSKKLEDLQDKIDLKVYEKCGSKFDSVEEKVMKELLGELKCLAMPVGFKHPSNIPKLDTGLNTIIECLNTKKLISPISHITILNNPPLTSQVISPRTTYERNTTPITPKYVPSEAISESNPKSADESQPNDEDQYKENQKRSPKSSLSKPNQSLSQYSHSEPGTATISSSKSPISSSAPSPKQHHRGSLKVNHGLKTLTTLSTISSEMSNEKIMKEESIVSFAGEIHQKPHKTYNSFMRESSLQLPPTYKSILRVPANSLMIQDTPDSSMINLKNPRVPSNSMQSVFGTNSESNTPTRAPANSIVVSGNSSVAQSSSCTPYVSSHTLHTTKPLMRAKSSNRADNQTTPPEDLYGVSLMVPVMSRSPLHSNITSPSVSSMALNHDRAQSNIRSISNSSNTSYSNIRVPATSLATVYHSDSLQSNSAYGTLPPTNSIAIEDSCCNLEIPVGFMAPENSIAYFDSVQSLAAVKGSIVPENSRNFSNSNSCMNLPEGTFAPENSIAYLSGASSCILNAGVIAPENSVAVAPHYLEKNERRPIMSAFMQETSIAIPFGTIAPENSARSEMSGSAFSLQSNINSIAHEDSRVMIAKRNAARSKSTISQEASLAVPFGAIAPENSAVTTSSTHSMGNIASNSILGNLRNAFITGNSSYINVSTNSLAIPSGTLAPENSIMVHESTYSIASPKSGYIAPENSTYQPPLIESVQYKDGNLASPRKISTNDSENSSSSFNFQIPSGEFKLSSSLKNWSENKNGKLGNPVQAGTSVNNPSI